MMKWRFHLKHVKGTLELLGTSVGRDPERIESFLDNKFRSWAPTLDIISAILDDITLAGEEQGVFKAFTRLQELLEQDELGIGT